MRFLQLWVSPEDRIKQYSFEKSRKIIIDGIHMHMFIIWCSEVQFGAPQCPVFLGGVNPYAVVGKCTERWELWVRQWCGPSRLPSIER